MISESGSAVTQHFHQLVQLQVAHSDLDFDHLDNHCPDHVLNLNVHLGENFVN